jgi:hypothetical protein
VYYFHSTTRCPTCQDIEAQAHAVIQSGFAAEMASGKVVWKVLNYEQPSVADLAKKFEIQMPVVVLAKMKSGEVADWKRLDRVWALVGDKPAYGTYVRDEINKMLQSAEVAPAVASVGDKRAAEGSATEPAEATASVPVDLPIPE